MVTFHLLGLVVVQPMNPSSRWKWLLSYQVNIVVTVTIARAIELKHSSSLVSALAYETSQLYTSAGIALLNTSDLSVCR